MYSTHRGSTTLAHARNRSGHGGLPRSTTGESDRPPRLSERSTLNPAVIMMLSASWLALASRDIGTTSDTAGYALRYEMLGFYSIGELLRGEVPFFEKDRLFWVAAKPLHELGMGSHAWLAILSGAFILGVAQLIRCYSTMPVISITMLFGLGYVHFSSTALRQTVALSLILVAIPILSQRRFRSAIALVFLAGLFHSSAIVFLLFFPLAMRRFGWVQVLALGAAIAGTTFYSAQARELIRVVGWTENLSGYADQSVSLTWAGFLIHSSILLFCWVMLVRKNGEPVDHILFNLAVLGLCFLAFSTEIAESFRLAIFFSIVEIVLVPRAISQIRDARTRHLVCQVVIASSLFYLAVSGAPVHYFGALLR